MSIRKMTAVLALTGALSGGAVVVSDAALASGCYTAVSGTYGGGHCDASVLPRYFAQVQCYDPVHDSYSYVYGATVYAPNMSSAYCAAGHGNAVGVSMARA
jgi:hypothetical protein